MNREIETMKVNEEKNTLAESQDRKTEPGFTPGPWFYRRADGYNGFFIAHQTNESRSGMRGIAGTYGHPDETGVEANARLIAAAPSLYEALRGLRRVNHRCYCSTWVGGEHEPECEAARAALALVHGKVTTEEGK